MLYLWYEYHITLTRLCGMSIYIYVLFYEAVRKNNSYIIKYSDAHFHNCSSYNHYMSRNMRKPTMWTRSDTNQAVQLLDMARGLKFVFRK